MSLALSVGSTVFWTVLGVLGALVAVWPVLLALTGLTAVVGLVWLVLLALAGLIAVVKPFLDRLLDRPGE